MQTIRSLTKEDLITLINQSFPDEKHTIVASFVSVGSQEFPQQAILLHKALDEMK